jgi:hypothetical protein
MKSIRSFMFVVVAFFGFALLTGCDETTYVVQPAEPIVDAAVEVPPVAVEAEEELPQPTPVEEVLPEPVLVESPAVVPDPDILVLSDAQDPFKKEVRGNEIDVVLNSGSVFCKNVFSDRNRIEQLIFKVNSQIAARDLFKRARFQAAVKSYGSEANVRMVDDLLVVDFWGAWTAASCEGVMKSGDFALFADMKEYVPAGITFQVDLVKVQPHEWDATVAGNTLGNQLVVKDSSKTLPSVTSYSSSNVLVEPGVLTDVGSFDISCYHGCGVEEIRLYVSNAKRVQVQIHDQTLDLVSGNYGEYTIDPSWGLGGTVPVRILVDSNVSEVYVQVRRLAFKLDGDYRTVVAPEVVIPPSACGPNILDSMNGPRVICYSGDKG